MEFVEGETLKSSGEGAQMIDGNKPLDVIYCGVCSMPPEFCEFGTCYDLCLPWILENCPEILTEKALALAEKTKEEAGEATEGEDKAPAKSKGGGAAAPKKSAAVQLKIVIGRIQRQKRKFVTAITGLDRVPDLKIKDVARAFGRKFSSGASVSDTNTGDKEIVIQGDVSFDVPAFLISEFKIPENVIYFLEDGNTLRPYCG